MAAGPEFSPILCRIVVFNLLSLFENGVFEILFCDVESSKGELPDAELVKICCIGTCSDVVID